MVPVSRHAIQPTSSLPDSEHFDNLVARLTSRCVTLWSETSEEPPEFREHFSFRQKVRMENECESVFQKMPLSSEAYRTMDEADRARMRAKVRTLLAKSLFHVGDATTNQFFDDCDRATEAFVCAAKQLDPGLAERDIHQALRNLWVFNSLQLYLKRPVSLSPSSTAYSLLYPYTDNWLDTAGRSAEEKESFLYWMMLRLQGKEGTACDRHRATMTGFLKMIEEEYPRVAFPGVYRSLLAIHCAQRKSLLLQGSDQHADEAGLLRITFEKGGTSVLADGFLVSGELQATHIDALFGYGVLLQLIDDLQDFEEDRHTGYSTPFSRAAKTGNLDRITNRLFNFTGTILTFMDDGESNKEMRLTQIIEQSCHLLIREAVARYHALYSEAYLRMIERSSPMRLSYLGLLRQRLKGSHV